MTEQHKYYTLTEDVKTLIQYIQEQAIDHSVVEAANRLDKAIEKGVDVGLAAVTISKSRYLFEKERKQYAKDCRTHKIEFVPEYYSGINWRDAEHLVGKTVECTNNPDAGWSSGILMLFDTVSDDTYYKFAVKKQACLLNRIYIRTCEETFKHPTINIGGVELPKPETIVLARDTKYWVFPYPAHRELFRSLSWRCSPSDIDALQAGQIHLTEDRAKAWADWWKKEVLAKIDEVVS